MTSCTKRVRENPNLFWRKEISERHHLLSPADCPFLWRSCGQENRDTRQTCKPVLAVRSVPAAAQALRVQPISAAVIVVVAGRPAHETFKSPMIDMIKLLGIPFPSKVKSGRCSIYKKSVSR